MAAERMAETLHGGIERFLTIARNVHAGSSCLVRFCRKNAAEPNRRDTAPAPPF
jgi:hypothetical protein